MSTQKSIDAFTEESRLITLDFAWLDSFFSLLLVSYLLYNQRIRILKYGMFLFYRLRHTHEVMIVAYCFGIFAWVMDYIVGYLITQTRTIEYTEGSEPMSSFGTLW